MGVSRVEAQNLINSYKAGLPEIKTYMDRIKEFKTAHACVYTPWGRRSELPEIRNPRVRAYSLRAAINAPIQVFGADLMRLDTVNIDKNITNNPTINMLMQVNYVMVFECDAEVVYVMSTPIKGT